MGAAETILRSVLPAFYAAAALNSVWIFVRRSDRALRLAKPLLGLAVLGHAVQLALRAARYGACPLGTGADAISLLAFALTAVYTLVEMRRGSRPTGILILPLSFLLVLLSALFARDPGEISARLADPWFSLHAAGGVFAVGALAVSFVHAVFYLLLYREIRAHRFGRLFRRLPPLATLSRMTHIAAVVGWALLLVAIGAGYARALRADTLASLGEDGFFLVTCGVFLVYTAGLGARFLAGFRGRFSVYVSVGGFAVLLVSLILVSFFSTSMHGPR